MERLIRSGESAQPGIGPAPAAPHALKHAVRARRGFTFVELMVVISIIVILISMAIPIYQKSIIRAKESVLANNLFTLRTVIDNYTYDKEKAPQTLQDLVTEGYLQGHSRRPDDRRQPELEDRHGGRQPGARPG